MNPIKILKKVRDSYFEKKYQTTSAILKNLERNTIISPQNWDNNHITLQLVGHSTYLINMYGKRILTDPVFSKKIGFKIIRGKRMGSKRRSHATLSLDDIHKLDYVILSHAHMDHWDTDSLRAITKRFPNTVTFICPRNTQNLLRWVPNIKQIVPLEWDEEVILDDIIFNAHETNHRGARYFLIKVGVKYKKGKKITRGYNSYVISYRGKHLFFAGDTAYTPIFKDVKKNIDIAMMPIGGYTIKNNHCSPEEAREMANDMHTKRFLPMHFETFHSSKQPIYRLYEESKKQQHNTPMQLGLSSIGEIFVLPEK